MALEPNTFAYQLLYVLVLIVLAGKFVFSSFLAKKIFDKKKSSGKFQFDFIFGVFILMLFLFISRLLYFYYDFYLTQFDSDNFLTTESLLVWGFASLISTLGYAVAMFAVDYKVLNFRLKGIVAYLILLVGIVSFIFSVIVPVQTLDDFQLINGILLISNLLAVVIPIIFFYIGIKTKGLRKVAFLIAFGVIIFAVGSTLVIQPILAPLRNAFGDDIQIVIFFIFFVMKITGLAMFSYGVSKFSI